MAPDNDIDEVDGNGGYVSFNYDDNLVQVKTDQIIFFFKIFNQATETDLLALISSGIENGGDYNGIEHLLLHGCSGTDFEEVDYSVVCDAVIKECKQDGQIPFVPDVGVKLNNKENSIKRKDSPGDDIYVESMVSLPFGLTSLFTNLYACKGEADKNEEHDGKRVSIWPESGPKVSNPFEYDKFFNNVEPYGKYQKIGNKRISNTTFCSCITPYKVVLSDGSENRDEIVVQPTIQPSKCVEIIESSLADRKLLFEPQVTLEDLNELCFLLLVSKR